jgi:hypothetical protein
MRLAPTNHPICTADAFPSYFPRWLTGCRHLKKLTVVFNVQDNVAPTCIQVLFDLLNADDPYIDGNARLSIMAKKICAFI